VLGKPPRWPGLGPARAPFATPIVAERVEHGRSQVAKRRKAREADHALDPSLRVSAAAGSAAVIAASSASRPGHGASGSVAQHGAVDGERHDLVIEIERDCAAVQHRSAADERSRRSVP
jgi:hypothetical protein